MNENIIHIAIAEKSPIVSAGLSHTVGRLPGLPAHAIELKNPDDLYACLKSEHIEILIINPFYEESVDVQKLRSIRPELKIAAIATAPLDKKKKEIFDEIISIADDIETIAEKIKGLSSSKEATVDSKEPISNREKEIIINVVKGLTNKEIADKLFLSVHTVITHRRNIARKLEIHSATGLTIYAIVNKLVDISELHL